jgi:SagB-type dehydrogenase family enzyme
MKDRNAPLFDLFWENGKLNDYTGPAIGMRVEKDGRTLTDPPWLDYHGIDVALSMPGDVQAQLLLGRKSERVFSDRPLSLKQLGSLFAGFRAASATHRPLASGGGKYPVEVFALAFNIEGMTGPTALYYHPMHHGLSRIAACPEWEVCRNTLGTGLEGMPALYVVFCIFPDRSTRKYGERGGRFALFETGMYAQTLALRLAQEKLAGVPYAAFHDEELKHWLGLQDGQAQVALAYACGHREKSSGFHSRP